MLHYLRIARFKRTEPRGKFVRQTYDQTSSQSVRRACIDCWSHWGDRGSFTRLRNQWQNLSADEQRMLWLAAGRFGDEGEHAKKQLRRTLEQVWQIGFEEGQGSTFASLYRDWANNAN
jgi:hypothetical protein